jgi:hypothetical protein
MDGPTFIKHFNNRHQNGLANMGPLPEDMAYQDEQRYRAFHRRLHQSRLPHFHDPDPPEAGIDRAIECLIENRDWGWKEIADVYGYVAAFPDGQLATRVDGIIFHHKKIEDATDRLMTATKRAAKIARTSRR